MLRQSHDVRHISYGKAVYGNVFNPNRALDRNREIIRPIWVNDRMKLRQKEMSVMLSVIVPVHNAERDVDSILTIEN